MASPVRPQVQDLGAEGVGAGRVGDDPAALEALVAATTGRTANLSGGRISQESPLVTVVPPDASRREWNVSDGGLIAPHHPATLEQLVATTVDQSASLVCRRIAKVTIFITERPPKSAA